MSSREFLSWTETAAAVIRITVHNEQWQHGKRIWKSSFEQMFFKLKVNLQQTAWTMNEVYIIGFWTWFLT